MEPCSKSNNCALLDFGAERNRASGLLPTWRNHGGIFVVPIDKSYFRRQAPLLRRMVRLTRNPVVADRLSEMVREYEMKANDGPDEPPAQAAKGDKDDGQKN